MESRDLECAFNGGYGPEGPIEVDLVVGELAKYDVVMVHFKRPSGSAVQHTK